MVAEVYPQDLPGHLQGVDSRVSFMHLDECMDLDEWWAAGCDEQKVVAHDCSPVLVRFGHCFVAVCH